MQAGRRQIGLDLIGRIHGEDEDRVAARCHLVT